MGRFGVCTCGWSFFGGGIGAYVFTLTPVSSMGQALTLSLGERGKDWRIGESGELFQVLEVLEDRFQEFLVVLGSGVGLWVVVTMMVGGVVVPWGAAATGGAVLFGHVGSEEHHQEGWRGAGLLSASEEHELEHVGVPEDGYFESIVEPEGVFDLPLPGGTDGYPCIIGGEAGGPGPGELVEVDGL